MNRYRQQNAGQRWNSYMTPYDKDADMWSNLVDSSFKAAERGRSLLGRIGSPYSGAEGSFGGGHTGHIRGGETDNRDAVSKELDANRDKIEQLSHESVSASAERKKAIQEEIAKLKERNQSIEDAIAEAKGETTMKPEAGSKADLDNQLQPLAQGYLRRGRI